MISSIAEVPEAGRTRFQLRPEVQEIFLGDRLDIELSSISQLVARARTEQIRPDDRQ